MRTLLKTVVAATLMLVFTGPAVAAVLNAGSLGVNLGTPGVDPVVLGSAATGGLGGLEVTGGGSTIGGTADHGYFVYAAVAGDGYIIAKVQSFNANYSTSRLAGLMIRQSLADDAVNAANMVMPNEVGTTTTRHARGQVRTSEGGSTEWIQPDAGQEPGVGKTIRLTRAGDTITFSWLDGTTWRDYSETATVPMTGTIYVGLAVTAGNAERFGNAHLRVRAVQLPHDREYGVGQRRQRHVGFAFLDRPFSLPRCGEPRFARCGQHGYRVRVDRRSRGAEPDH